jgi:hypothetical protein
MSKSMDSRETRSEISLYQTEDGRPRLHVRMDGETVWPTQAQMADLLQSTPQNVMMHNQSLCGEAELSPAATCESCLQVRREGKRNVQRVSKRCNLDLVKGFALAPALAG